MHDALTFCLIYFAALLVLGASGFPVAFVMVVITIASIYVLVGPQMLGPLSDLAWTTMNNFILIAMPLYILLGDIMLRSRITERMYQSLAIWMERVPGGLLHSNIMACSLFAASTGSSIATAATMGTVALPELNARGYDKRLSFGSIAAGGTLGILIPPSINLVIYGVLTDTSIGRLLIAGIVPGLLLAATFMLTIALFAVLKPEVAPLKKSITIPMSERIASLKSLIPPLLVIFTVIGSIYTGLATPTESAALGIIMATALAAWYGGLSIPMLNECFRSTLRTTGMIMAIITAAFLMNFVVGFLGIPQDIAQWVRSLGLSPIAVLWLLLLMYGILGCFLEALSMMVTTIPIVAPLVVSLGVDPVWFGVFTVLVTELALVTPPVGMNLYVVQGIRTDSGGINDVIVGSLPFVVALVLFTILMMYFPEIVTWLPNRMMGK
jgi:tripartite ATP-independent transporter DctM subunit